MTSVVHVDPEVELGETIQGPPPASPTSEEGKEEVEPWIAQVKSREGGTYTSCPYFHRNNQYSWSF